MMTLKHCDDLFSNLGGTKLIFVLGGMHRD
jgi:hypothetical protein